MNASLKTETYEIRYNEMSVKENISWESHCHPCYELIAVIEGAINVVFEGKSLRCERGQMLLAPPLHYHSVCVDTQSSYSRIVVSFDISEIPKSIGDRIFSLASADPVFSADWVLDTALELKKILVSESMELYSPLAQALMTRLIYKCAESEREVTDLQSGDAQHKLIEKAILFIDSHIKEKITLDDLAAHLFISKSSLSNLFTSQMQISPKQYIIRKKIAYAEKLMSEGYRAVDAARVIGYDNYSNFYRIKRKQR